MVARALFDTKKPNPELAQVVINQNLLEREIAELKARITQLEGSHPIEAAIPTRTFGMGACRRANSSF